MWSYWIQLLFKLRWSKYFLTQLYTTSLEQTMVTSFSHLHGNSFLESIIFLTILMVRIWKLFRLTIMYVFVDIILIIQRESLMMSEMFREWQVIIRNIVFKISSLFKNFSVLWAFILFIYKIRDIQFMKIDLSTTTAVCFEWILNENIALTCIRTR